MKRITPVLILLLCSLSASGQRMDLSLFKDSVLPAHGRGELLDVTRSPNRFEVKIVHDSLQVFMVNDSTQSHTSTFPLRKGKLVSYDNGESGGALVYVNAEGSADTIFQGAVQHIFSCYGRIFFTNGVWYQTTHYGQLYQLDTTHGEFHSKIYASFDYPIRRCHVTRDTMYLITDGTLYRMQYGKAVSVTTVPVSNNTMATQGRFMYFGMRGGYARLDLKTKKYRYFVYVGE